MRSILVIRSGALGDGLLTLPALAALRTRWPPAHITLVGQRSLAPFACAAGFVDTGEPIEGAAGLALLGEAGPTPEWARADLAVVWLQRWAGAARRLAAWGIPEIVAGPSLPPPGAACHITDHLCATLAPLGIGPSRLATPIPAPTQAAAAAEYWWQSHVPIGSAPTIALQPGSGGLRKCWPLGRFASLAARLTSAGFRLLACLGPAETENAARHEQILDAFPGAVLATNLTVDVLAAVIARCAALVGNDSGVTHLAAALGVPTVALFGPTDPGRWAPQGRWVRSLRDPGWQPGSPADDADAWRLQPSEVEQALKELLAAV